MYNVYTIWYVAETLTFYRRIRSPARRPYVFTCISSHVPMDEAFTKLLEVVIIDFKIKSFRWWMLPLAVEGLLCTRMLSHATLLIATAEIWHIFKATNLQ